MTDNDHPQIPALPPANIASDRSVSTGQFVAGRFRVDKLIARGGQASVYLATQLPLNRPVALKILMPLSELANSDPEQFQVRFLQEARALATLNHPNIVVIYDYGEVSPGRLYIAMEYVDGVRFNDILREQPVDPMRALRICYQVCAALRFAHQHGIVHRDIKNSNILVTRDEHGNDLVKVVDFGIAKLLERDKEITEVGIILGSPHFIAPEQVKGYPTDHRADIYSIGVLLYCGLVGRYPFDGPTSTSIFTAHVLQEVPPWRPEDMRGIITPALERVVRRCLARELDDRYSDMSAVMADLRPFITDLDPSASERTPELEALVTVIEPSRPRMWLWGIAGLVIAVLLGLATFQVLTSIGLLQSRVAAEVPVVEPIVTPPAPPPESVAAPPTAPAVIEEPPAVPVEEPKAATPVVNRTRPKPPSTTVPPTAPPVSPPEQPPAPTEDMRKSDLRDPWKK